MSSNNSKEEVPYSHFIIDTKYSHRLSRSKHERVKIIINKVMEQAVIIRVTCIQVNGHHSKLIWISPSSPCPKSWSSQALGSMASAPTALAPTSFGIVAEDRSSGRVG